MAREPKRLVTEVEVTATPDVVWDVITDVDAYRHWNPFIVAGSGEPEVGAKLDLRMRPSGRRSIQMKPTVTEARMPTTFEWLGHLGIRGIFDGRHRFEIESTPTGSRVIHSEEFTGILVPLLSRMLDEETKQGFEAMNAALRERAEIISTRSG